MCLKSPTLTVNCLFLFLFLSDFALYISRHCAPKIRIVILLENWIFYQYKVSFFIYLVFCLNIHSIWHYIAIPSYFLFTWFFSLFHIFSFLSPFFWVNCFCANYFCLFFSLSRKLYTLNDYLIKSNMLLQLIKVWYRDLKII